MQALVSLRAGTGKEGMGLCPAREGLRKDHMKAAEGAGCFPEEGTVCSKTPRRGGCSLGGRFARNVRSLCLALPFLESEVGKRGIAFPLKVRRGKVGGGREGWGELNTASMAEDLPSWGLTDPPGFKGSLAQA